MTLALSTMGCDDRFSFLQKGRTAIQVPAISHPLNTLRSGSGWVYAVTLSPDGRYLVSGSYDKHIKIWSPASGRLRHTLKGHGDAVVSLAIDPSSRILASGSWDNRLKLWDLATGKLLRTLNGHHDDVEALTMSPDGKWLASASADATVRIWELQTGQEIQRFKDEYMVRAIAFSPDGAMVVSGNEQGEIKFCKFISRNFFMKSIKLRHYSTQFGQRDPPQKS